MRQKTSILLAGLSLTVALASAGLGVHSYWWADVLERGTETGTSAFRSSGGLVVYEQCTIVGDDPPAPEVVFRRSPRSFRVESPWRLCAVEDDVGGGRRVSLLGGGWSTEPWPVDVPHSFYPLVVAVPHWAFALIFAAYPLTCLRMRRGRPSRWRAARTTGNF